MTTDENLEWLLFVSIRLSSISTVPVAPPNVVLVVLLVVVDCCFYKYTIFAHLLVIGRAKIFELPCHPREPNKLKAWGLREIKNNATVF
jgi:hypothetical protein